MASAVDIDAFYQAHVPIPCTAKTLLVISADGKGIVMRPKALRPATQKAAARPGLFRTRLASGEKPARKRMATLAAVYDAEPAPRRPHDVIAPPGGRSGRRKLRPGPKASAKWLYGSVIDDAPDVIKRAFDQAEARDAGHHRPWVVLVDGAVINSTSSRPKQPCAASRSTSWWTPSTFLSTSGRPHDLSTTVTIPPPRTGSPPTHSPSSQAMPARRPKPSNSRPSQRS